MIISKHTLLSHFIYILKELLGVIMQNLGLSEIIKTLSNTSEKSPTIPKEVLDQYPYGEFPLRYTKSGQDFLRKNSETRYLNDTPPTQDNEENNTSNSLDLSTILTLTSLLTNKKKQPSDMLELISTILFKDNPEMKKLLKLLAPTTKAQEVTPKEDFPDTNKVCISTLKRIN